jgi:hypothetical protein
MCMALADCGLGTDGDPDGNWWHSRSTCVRKNGFCKCWDRLDCSELLRVDACRPGSRRGPSAGSSLSPSTTVALTYPSLAHNMIALQTDLPA